MSLSDWNLTVKTDLDLHYIATNSAFNLFRVYIYGVLAVFICHLFLVCSSSLLQNDALWRPVCKPEILLL